MEQVMSNKDLCVHGTDVMLCRSVWRAPVGAWRVMRVVR